MKKFTKKDIGKTVFSATNGLVTIKEIKGEEEGPYTCLADSFPVHIDCGYLSFSVEGKIVSTDLHPILFRSYEDFIEYWKENKPKEKKVFEKWVNIYNCGDSAHETKELADEYAAHDRIKCLHIRQEYEI